jgi:uncharacterized membrane protein
MRTMTSTFEYKCESGNTVADITSWTNGSCSHVVFVPGRTLRNAHSPYMWRAIDSYNICMFGLIVVLCGCCSSIKINICYFACKHCCFLFCIISIIHLHIVRWSWINYGVRVC